MRRFSKPIMITAGVLSILLGIISIFNPVSTLSVLATYIGIVFFITGVMYIIGYARDYYEGKPGWILMQGLIDILFGVLLMFNSTFFAFSVAYLIAIWAFVIGVLRITSALELKKANFMNWGALFTLGAVSVIFSVLVFMNPVIGAGIVAFALGIMLITMGIGTIAQCSML